MPALLMLGQLQVHVFEGRARDLEVGQLDSVRHRPGGEVIEGAGRVRGLQDGEPVLPAHWEGQRGCGDPVRELEADVGQLLCRRAQGFGGALSDHFSRCDHADTVGKVLRLVHVVRGQNDGFAEGPHVAHDLPGGTARRGVETGGRFVEKDELGIAHQAERDVEATLLAAGKLADPLAGLLGEPDQVDDLRGRSRGRVIASIELDELDDREHRRHGRFLKHQPHPLPEVAPARLWVDPEHGHGARVPLPVALEDFNRGGLAGTVRSQKAEDLSLLHREAHSADRLNRAVGLAQTVNGDGCHGKCSPLYDERSQSRCAMVPETGVGADHNWPQRMTMTTTNVEILRQGWLDAASALAPGLDALPEFLERGLEAAVIDERLDEQSLLRVVTDVTADAADSLPAEELYFLTRRLQRAVYEYLLSLDALPEPPPRREGTNGHAPQDATLIGAEEVAALGRNGHAKTAVEPSHVSTETPELDPEPEPTPDATSEVQAGPDAAATAADRVEAGLAELDAQLSPDEPDDVPEATDEPETETLAGAEAAPDSSPEPATRPAFTLFRRTGAAAKSDKGAPSSNGDVADVPEATGANGSSAAHDDLGGEDPESFVKPKDGFHLSDLADFA